MSEPRMLAGHAMVDTIHGEAGQLCGYRLVDLLMMRREDIGKSGWAHYGELNGAEYASVDAERDRIYGHARAIASGEGVGGSAPGDLVDVEEF